MSLFLSLHMFDKDASTTIQDRKFIFGIQNNNDTFLSGIDNQLCTVCASLYLLSFISLHAINTVIVRNRFLSNFSR